MNVRDDLSRKAQFKMRSLVSEIRELSDACRKVPGQVSAESGVQFEHIDSVLIALDHALITIRTLDKEVFEKSDPVRYGALRDANGAVVRGLTAPRNGAVHSSDVIDPDIARAVGPINDAFVVFPKWKQRTDLPATAFGDQTSKGTLLAYDSTVAGRHLHDTLLDALAFFHDCDGTVLPRTPEGQIEGLPLAPLPFGGYYRLTIAHPSHEEAEAIMRARVTAQPPGGISRRIDGYLDAGPRGLYLCGYTMLSSAPSWAFTEPERQVVADIVAGYRYWIDQNGTVIPVTVSQKQLLVATAPIQTAGLPDLSAATPWDGWVELASTDAAYYRSQRQPS